MFSRERPSAEAIDTKLCRGSRGVHCSCRAWQPGRRSDRRTSAAAGGVRASRRTRVRFRPLSCPRPLRFERVHAQGGPARAVARSGPAAISRAEPRRRVFTSALAAPMASPPPDRRLRPAARELAVTCVAGERRTRALRGSRGARHGDVRRIPGEPHRGPGDRGGRGPTPPACRSSSTRSRPIRSGC